MGVTLGWQITNTAKALLMLALTLAVIKGARGVVDAIDRHGERCVPAQLERLGEG